MAECYWLPSLCPMAFPAKWLLLAHKWIWKLPCGTSLSVCVIVSRGAGGAQQGAAAFTPLVSKPTKPTHPPPRTPPQPIFQNQETCKGFESNGSYQRRPRASGALPAGRRAWSELRRVRQTRKDRGRRVVRVVRAVLGGPPKAS